MPLRMWRLLTVMLTALSMATVFCHLMQMPAKLKVDEALWLAMLQTVYPPAFGTVGAFFEVGAIVTTVVLAFLVRHRRPAYRWTFAAALCMVAADAAFWIWIAPVNAVMTPATPYTLPEGWQALRAQWEYTHAARALLQVAALGALVHSILGEVPAAASK